MGDKSGARRRGKGGTASVTDTERRLPASDANVDDGGDVGIRFAGSLGIGEFAQRGTSCLYFYRDKNGEGLEGSVYL